jgi:hypothetical protein
MSAKEASSLFLCWRDNATDLLNCHGRAKIRL